ncbi:6-hydroxy-D-nicotine oxidase [Paramyrothecium foliicola]|nr:6-hydroxy-D-nicotine oxidase [Paramyrothecium foliicola]
MVPGNTEHLGFSIPPLFSVAHLTPKPLLPSPASKHSVSAFLVLGWYRVPTLTNSPMPRPINSTDIDQLRSLLKDTDGLIRTPKDKGYEESIRRWSAAAERPAGVAIVPTSASQISTILKYAEANKIDLAVRGGGHSTSGSSSTNGGLLIDLRALNQVEVDAEKKSVKVGGGASWGHVDAETAKYGLATVGGTISDTGVGGLTLGGGYGWLSGLHGLTIDNLLSATVVLASGEILKASESENVDLFWGLRGAGQNFGVVVEFEFKLYVQGNLWTGILAFPPSTPVVQKITQAMNDLYCQTAPNEKSKYAGRAAGAINILRPPNDRTKVALAVVVMFNGTEEEGKKAFKAFYDIGPVMESVKWVPYDVANQILSATPGNRVSMKGAAFTLPLQAGLVQELITSYDAFTKEIPDMENSMILLECFDPYVVATRATNSDTSFANRGWHMNASIQPSWTKPEFDAQGRQWARDVTALFDKWFKKAGSPTRSGDYGSVLAYGNYDHYDQKNSKDIFGPNYARLQDLKVKYDPNNMFNKLFAVRQEQ